MTVRKILLHVMLWAIIAASVLPLPGCLQEYLPRLQEEKVGENHFAGEETEQWEEESLPPGVLYPKIYLVDGKGKYLLPVTVSFPWTEGVARATLEKLIEGPTPAQEMRHGLHSPLPLDTEVLGLSIRDGLAKLDLNAAFLDYNPGEEEFVISSILFTLLQFPAVNSVQLLVEGIVPETFPGGTSGQEIWSKGEGINRETEEELADLENSRAVTLYFCTVLGENHVYYVPVTRLVAADKGIVEATIEELFKGPRAGSSLFSDLPAGVLLQGFVLQEGLLTVDFSKEILYYRGGRRGEKNMLMQLVLTLTEIPGVHKVQLLIAGEKMNLPYGTPCCEPLTRPLVINSLVGSSSGGVYDGPDLSGENEEEKGED